ncbi:carbohydrate sulfotransferase 9-like isoform X4 [Pomacea canaliculata]|uniref:carbohydrate sulfotransferase 9-like isoform X4 n=1 Tax=Pomacea canaliculata TaxID=400727 RepID=UPI000D73B7C7|nr:carbohydrate sulfotransferase 9-like isoform X4 [Pomacea canaliculata]
MMAKRTRRCAGLRSLKRACRLLFWRVCTRRSQQVLAVCIVIGLFLTSIASISVAFTPSGLAERYRALQTQGSMLTADNWLQSVSESRLTMKKERLTVNVAKKTSVRINERNPSWNMKERKPFWNFKERMTTPAVSTTTTTTTTTEDPLTVAISQAAAMTVGDMEQRLGQLRDKIRRGKFAIKSTQSETNSSVFFHLSDLAAVQLNRSRRLLEVCEKVRNQSRAPSNSEGKPYHQGWGTKNKLWRLVEVYIPQHFLFCPALKVGSTFWRRLLYALQTGRSIASPYDITIKKALETPHQHLSDVAVGLKMRVGDSSMTETLTGDVAVQRFLDVVTKVMFTRQPYSKLLSAYVDKLYSPNPFFWGKIGRHIVRKFRSRPSAKSVACGHDVTFPEFVKYVIESQRSDKGKRDEHFMPVYEQCKPCDIPYDIIGKIESFKTDVALVMSEFGFNLSQSTFDSWLQLSEVDAISDSITSPYGWRRHIVKCLSWEEANRRIWRKMQIRGIIDKKEEFPRRNFSHFSYSPSKFTQVVQESWDRFKRRNTSRSAQKTEALTSAYSLVPKEDLELLREYYLLDFDIFGYPSRPDSVFSGRKTWDVFNVSS